MAIEDAICIARLLPATTPTHAVEERLKMFKEIRYKRAEYVRDETRQNGLGESERPTSLFCLSDHGMRILLTGSRYVSDDEVLLRS